MKLNLIRPWGYGVKPKMYKFVIILLLISAVNVMAKCNCHSFIRASLARQVEYALDVALHAGSKVYVFFDDRNFQDKFNVTYQVYNNIRYGTFSDGNQTYFMLLSEAARLTLSREAYIAHLPQIEGAYYSFDGIGVCVLGDSYFTKLYACK